MEADMDEGPLRENIRRLAVIEAADPRLCQECVQECWHEINKHAQDRNHSVLGKKIDIDRLASVVSKLFNEPFEGCQKAAEQALLQTQQRIAAKVIDVYYERLERKPR